MQEPEPKPYPKAVFFIIGNEFCERFSYYGMRTPGPQTSRRPGSVRPVVSGFEMASGRNRGPFLTYATHEGHARMQPVALTTPPTVPTFTDQDAKESVVDFIDDLSTMRTVCGLSELDVLQRLRPVALRAILFGRSFPSVEELARFAREVSQPVFREHHYDPPPPSDVPLEPACASTSASRFHDHLVDYFTTIIIPSVHAMGLDDAAANEYRPGAPKERAAATVAESAESPEDAAGPCDAATQEADDMCGYERALENGGAELSVDVPVGIRGAQEAEEFQGGEEEADGCPMGERDVAGVIEENGEKANAAGENGAKRGDIVAEVSDSKADEISTATEGSLRLSTRRVAAKQAAGYAATGGRKHQSSTAVQTPVCTAAGHNSTPVESLDTRVKSARRTTGSVNCKKMGGVENQEEEGEYHVEAVEYYDVADGNPQDDEEIECVNADDAEVDNGEGAEDGIHQVQEHRAEGESENEHTQAARRCWPQEDVVRSSRHGDRWRLLRAARTGGLPRTK
ncbi:hypothetical protein MTO96_008181 [Rhipicephalus appendiculatus]